MTDPLTGSAPSSVVKSFSVSGLPVVFQQKPCPVISGPPAVATVMVAIADVSFISSIGPVIAIATEAEAISWKWRNGYPLFWVPVSSIPQNPSVPFTSSPSKSQPAAKNVANFFIWAEVIPVPSGDVLLPLASVSQKQLSILSVPMLYPTSPPMLSSPDAVPRL